MSLDPPLNRLGRRRSPARQPFPRGSRSATTTAAAAVGARRRLVAGLVALAVLLAGGYLLLRDVALLRVTNVRVTGVTSSAAPRIEAALDEAARGMTTLHVRQDALERAVAGFPSVAGLHVSAHLPHRLNIEVVERRPVAALVAGGRRLAVTRDGRLLRDVQDTMGLPTIALPTLPAGERVSAPRTLAALAVAGVAPERLRRRAERVAYGPHGLTVALLDGPPLIFGSADRVAGKWAAAARVLADPSSAGATYLDLREPGRVAAGGLGPVVSEDAQGDATATPAPATTATPAVPAPTATATPTAPVAVAPATSDPYSQP